MYTHLYTLAMITTLMPHLRIGPYKEGILIAQIQMVYATGMAASEVVVCSLCNFRSPSLALWLSHLRQVHRSDPAVNITCPVSTCRAFYDKVNSFYSHMYRSHRALCIRTNVPLPLIHMLVLL